MLGDLAHRRENLREAMAEASIISLAIEPSERQHGMKQQIEISFSSSKRVFGFAETLPTT